MNNDSERTSDMDGYVNRNENMHHSEELMVPFIQSLWDGCEHETCQSCAPALQPRRELPRTSLH